MAALCARRPETRKNSARIDIEGGTSPILHLMTPCGEAGGPRHERIVYAAAYQGIPLGRSDRLRYNPRDHNIHESLPDTPSRLIIAEYLGMTSLTAGWTALIVSLALGAGKSAPKESVTLAGEVVELSVALKTLGLPFDPDPVAKQVVLRESNGTITPLLSDEASRALFVDERLRGRPAELKAYRFPGLPYIQVISVKVDDHGRLRTPEYFCGVCTISVRYPQICPCCQGPMELRMKPEPE